MHMCVLGGEKDLEKYCKGNYASYSLHVLQVLAQISPQHAH